MAGMLILSRRKAESWKNGLVWMGRGLWCGQRYEQTETVSTPLLQQISSVLTEASQAGLWQSIMPITFPWTVGGGTFGFPLEHIPRDLLQWSSTALR